MSVIYNKKQYKIRNEKDGRSSLNISNKKISDITQIHGLDQLQYLIVLNLDNNQISEIKGLGNLINLTTLSLKNNKISEIKGIENLSKLESLNLDNNQITEIKNLESLKNLKELHLWDNQITEIKGLQNLDELNMLGLSGNPVDIWAKTQLGPIENRPQAAVAYCKKLLGVVSYDSDELNHFLTNKWDEIADSIYKKDYWAVMKILKTVYNKVNAMNIEFFYKFFGDLLHKNPDLFNLNFLKFYNSSVATFLTTHQCAKLEKFILDNYCLYENEQIITYFIGIFSFKSRQIKGRIYVSNFRIIVLGTILVEDESESLWLFAPFWALTFELIEKINYGVQKRNIDNFRSSNELPRFGLEFPIWNPKSIWSSGRSIGFTSIITKDSRKRKIPIILQPTEIILDSKQQNPETIKDTILIIYKTVLETKEITL